MPEDEARARGLGPFRGMAYAGLVYGALIVALFVIWALFGAT